jgi:hypothetical protein
MEQLSIIVLSPNPVLFFRRIISSSSIPAANIETAQPMSLELFTLELQLISNEEHTRVFCKGTSHWTVQCFLQAPLDENWMCWPAFRCGPMGSITATERVMALVPF